MSFQQSRLYLRRAEVIIGPKVETTNSAIVPNNGRLFSENRINFQITRTDGSDANKAKISIYNMSQSSRNFLETLTPDDAKKARGVLFMRAGYRGGLGTIFFGDIYRPVTVRNEADIITTIETKDTGLALQNARISISLAKGATTNQIISAAAKKLFVTTGPRRGVPNRTYRNGFTFDGTVKDLLDQITSQLKTTWSIQDGEIVFIAEGENDGQLAVLVTPDTGLIGFPTKKENGFEFTSLLNPGFRPGRAVQLESKQLQGTQFGNNILASGALRNGGIIGKIVKVQHLGDTQEGQFVSKVEAVIADLEKL